MACQEWGRQHQRVSTRLSAPPNLRSWLSIGLRRSVRRSLRDGARCPALQILRAD